MTNTPALTPHKQLIAAFYQKLWNKADTSLVAGLMHADVTFRGSVGTTARGHEAVAAYVAQVTGALEGFTCDITHMVEEDDRIAVRLVFSGKHRGIFLGFAPAGERVTWAGSAHFTFRDGLIADVWVLGDVHGLIRQLQRQASGMPQSTSP